MKRLSTGVLAAVLAAGFGLSAVSAQVSNSQTSQGNIGTYATGANQTLAQSSGMPPADFGSPPSGEVPILFNDHHVYTKPDRLKQGRVLAALVRGNTILVPLRSMFEQMGATVSYDPASKTVDVSKPGSDVKVTVGKPEVVINGESRPLDVPPMIYRGAVVVPVRVISEGMGAYVQWVPDKRVVVVRYVPPAPPPTAPPPPPKTPAPVKATPAPTPTPTPTPKPINYEKYIVGDYIFSPKVYNEFSPGNTGTSSYAARGAIEFPLFGLPWMLAGDYRSYQYPHNSPFGAVSVPGCPDGLQDCVTVIGGYGQTSVPTFTARDTDFDGRFGLKIIDPRIYIGVGYLFKQSNYGYPRLNGVGFGAEKLPDLDQPFSIYGSAWYYPNVQGNYTLSVCGAACSTPAIIQGATLKLAYRIFKYQIGGTFNFGSSPVFLDFGYLGDQGRGKTNSPSDFNHGGGYVGLGLHF